MDSEERSGREPDCRADDGLAPSAVVVVFMAGASLRVMRIPRRCDRELCESDGDSVFYEYYQLLRDDESDEDAAEPGEDGELKSHWEGSHSPFGFIWSVASQTGWSVDYIMEGVSYQTLIMMLADAPRYVTKKQGSRLTGESAEEEARDIVGFYQSQLG